jgi:hypothetical protein
LIGAEVKDAPRRGRFARCADQPEPLDANYTMRSCGHAAFIARRFIGSWTLGDQITIRLVAGRVREAEIPVLAIECDDSNA